MLQAAMELVWQWAKLLDTELKLLEVERANLTEAIDGYVHHFDVDAVAGDLTAITERTFVESEMVVWI